MLFPLEEGGPGLQKALEELCRRAARAVEQGTGILVVSDRGATRELAPMPSLLATAGIHHHLIRKGLRNQCGLVIETGEAREVHHLCCLIGYGAGAVNPYLVIETLQEMISSGDLTEIDQPGAVHNFCRRQPRAS
jgi:hypothetical protein